MSTQVVYQTNADWYATREALVNNVLMKADTTEKGLIRFWFKKNPTLFMLSPTGKLQVKWSDVNEKKTLFNLVKNLLVPNPNEKLVIKPLKQQTWIDYPASASFKLYWCSEVDEYVLRKSLENSTRQNSEAIPSLVKTSSISETPKSDKDAYKNKLDKVSEALQVLRREFRYFREPSFNEVALKAGCLDTNTVRVALAFSLWSQQNFEDAKRTAEDALNLACWLRFMEKKRLSSVDPDLIEFAHKVIDSAALSVIKKAQLIRKEYPNLIPKVGLNGLIWPKQTKRKWKQVFGDEPPEPPVWKKM